MLPAREPSRPPKAERIHQEPLLKLGEVQGEQAEKTAGPKSRTAFLWRRQGPFTGIHPCMHPCASFLNLPPIQNSPRGPLHNQAHTGHPCAQPHPIFTSTQACTHTYVVHTHRAGIGESLGREAGRLLCCSCPRSGERLDPSFGRDPVKMMAGVGLPGPSPRAIISQATWPC